MKLKLISITFWLLILSSHLIFAQKVPKPTQGCWTVFSGSYKLKRGSETYLTVDVISMPFNVKTMYGADFKTSQCTSSTYSKYRIQQWIKSAPTCRGQNVNNIDTWNTDPVSQCTYAHHPDVATKYVKAGSLDPAYSKIWSSDSFSIAYKTGLCSYPGFVGAFDKDPEKWNYVDRELCLRGNPTPIVCTGQFEFSLTEPICWYDYVNETEYQPKLERAFKDLYRSYGSGYRRLEIIKADGQVVSYHHKVGDPTPVPQPPSNPPVATSPPSTPAPTSPPTIPIPSPPPVVTPPPVATQPPSGTFAVTDLKGEGAIILREDNVYVMGDYDSAQFTAVVSGNVVGAICEWRLRHPGLSGYYRLPIDGNPLCSLSLTFEPFFQPIAEMISTLEFTITNAQGLTAVRSVSIMRSYSFTLPPTSSPLTPSPTPSPTPIPSISGSTHGSGIVYENDESGIPMGTGQQVYQTVARYGERIRASLCENADFKSFVALFTSDPTEDSSVLPFALGSVCGEDENGSVVFAEVPMSEFGIEQEEVTVYVLVTGREGEEGTYTLTIETENEPSPTPTVEPMDSGFRIPGLSDCFPGDATVKLETGETRRMDALKVGDKVHIGDGKYSEVFFFTHRVPDRKLSYVAISTSNAKVRLSHKHYIPVHGKHLVIASEVRAGDQVTLGNGTLALVESVDRVESHGLYNPHTLEGVIVVDGVKASCYTQSVHPLIASWLLRIVYVIHKSGLDLIFEGYFDVDRPALASLASLMLGGPPKL